MDSEKAVTRAVYSVGSTVVLLDSEKVVKKDASLVGEKVEM